MVLRPSRRSSSRTRRSSQFPIEPRTTDRDFVPWRFSDAGCQRAWMVWTFRRMAQVQARMGIKATLCGNRACGALTPQPARSVLEVSGARCFHVDSFVFAIRLDRRS